MTDLLYCVFFFNDTATTEIYTLSLHDALPIYDKVTGFMTCFLTAEDKISDDDMNFISSVASLISLSIEITSKNNDIQTLINRSEEHTSELQSRQYLVCRLLLEKKKKYYTQCSS